MRSGAVLASLSHWSHAFVHDTVLPHHLPKDCACATWASNASSAALWSDVTAHDAAAASCAMPANALTPDLALPIYSPADGWCLCDTTDSPGAPWYTWCTPPVTHPSQINLLVLNATAVVVNFVTADGGSRSSSSVEAELRDGAGTLKKFAGFSTLYHDSTSTRALSYHHVTLSSLAERSKYEYRVRAAGGDSVPASEWSEWLNFTSLYSSGPTRLAIYADMGVFVAEGSPAPPTGELPAIARHNVGNLVDDLHAGLIDFAVHSGDHAYEFEVSGGARGDGYMDSYSAFLAHAPWAPGWGNHEYLESDRGNRLANISAGVIEERRTQREQTNRMFYSVDIGLLHLLHLDLSPYWCRFDGCVSVDTCGFPDDWVRDASSDDPDVRFDFAGFREEILAFTRADLAAVDRNRTPWVVVTSHYPMYETYDTSNQDNIAHARQEPDNGARGHASRTDSDKNDAPQPSKAQAILDFEPLLAEFAVDIYFAGHNHNYEVTWPVYDGKTAQKSYDNPEAPIHILSGSAGPPEWDAFVPGSPDWSREPRLMVNSYSRLVLLNSSVAQFEQVANDNGTVVDAFTITQTRGDRSAPFSGYSMIV